MTDHHDPWPLALDDNSPGASAGGERSGRRTGRGQVRSDPRPPSWASEDPFQQTRAVDEDDPFPPSRQARASQSQASQSQGGRRPRDRGIPQQQPSDVATGPMELARSEAQPVAPEPSHPTPATPATPPPGLPAGAAPLAAKPRSRREALAAERTGQPTGDQPAVAMPVSPDPAAPYSAVSDSAVSDWMTPRSPEPASAPPATREAPERPAPPQTPSQLFVREPLYGPADTGALPQLPAGDPFSFETTAPVGRKGRDRRTSAPPAAAAAPSPAPVVDRQGARDTDDVEAPPEPAGSRNGTASPATDSAATASLTAESPATGSTAAASPEETGRRRAATTVQPGEERGRVRAIGRVLLPLIAAGLALSAVSTLIPSNNSALVLLAAMAPLGALIAVPVIALAVHHHRRITALVAGLAAVLPWALVAGYATGAPQPPANASRLRILLVNSNEGQVDPAGIVSAARDLGVDVLVVNELTSMLAHDLTSAGIAGVLHPQYVSAASQGATQLGVWSRTEVTDPTAVPGTSMPAMSGTIMTQAGPVTIVAGHSPRPYPGAAPFFGDATTWADDLVALARAGSVDGPRVLVGDLNATPWNKQFRDLEASSGLTDAGNALGKGLRPTWPVWSPIPLSPIDHVLVGGGVGVRSIGTVVVDGSNHRALVVEVAVPPRKD